jgi:hypothetical protein
MDALKDWGDYLSIQPSGLEGAGWIATGFTLQNGGATQNVEIQVVTFRSR